MTLKQFFFLCVGLLLSHGVSSQLSGNVQSALDKLLSGVASDEPGIIIGVTTPDQTFYAKGKGSETLEGKTKLGPSNPLFYQFYDKRVHRRNDRPVGCRRQNRYQLPA